MNIAQLEVMIHHTYNPEPFPRDTLAVRDAHQMLLDNVMIEETIRSRVTNAGERGELVEVRTYRATEKGRVFVNALMSVPLPVLAYRMPIPAP
jgi:hypothetical protein